MSSEIQKRTKVSIVIPEALHQEMTNKIKQEGYGLRQVSIWVTEALEALLATPNYPELVKIGDSMSHFKKTIFVILEPLLYERLNQAVVEVRAQFPAMDGVKSRLFRTAIIQRLLRR
jgi:hypothetical protein